MSDWALSIDAWVIQDGNYPDFRRDQRIEVAVEFYAPEPLNRTASGGRSALGDGDGWYLIDGTVTSVLDSFCVVDCGILVYGAHAPAHLAPGDGVQGRVLLSVDHYLYFENLARRPQMPELIYTWDLQRIRRETAPFVLGTKRNVRVRDEAHRGLVEIEATDAWNDDGGHAEYVFDCQLIETPAKRTSSTAR